MKLTTKEIAVFGMLGALMYASKMLMELFPNVHLLAALTVCFTLVYRQKALYPIYIFVLLLGLFSGFPVWWIPHLYLWTVLWGAVMLLPKNICSRSMPWVCSLVCGLHGFLYGTLYAPFQALWFGMDLKGMIAWILAGLPWDILHGISNLILGFLIPKIVIILQQTKPSR